MGIKKRKVSSGQLKWKALQLNESVISGGIEGLIGIEELHDYTLSTKKSRRSFDGLYSSPVLRTVKVKVHPKKVRDLPSTEGVKTAPINEVKTVKKRKADNVNKNAKTSTSGVTKVLERGISLEIESKPSLKTKKKKKSNTIESKESNLSKKCEVESTNCVQAVKKKRMTSKERKLKQVAEKKLKAKGSTSPGSLLLISSKTKKSDKMKKCKRVEDKKDKSMIKKSKESEDVVESLKPVEGMEGWGGLNLPESILRALSDKGFKQPTEIQALTLPAAVLGRRDIMGAAETGSGKTLAFGIPILFGILQQKSLEAEKRNSPSEVQNEEEGLCREGLTEESVGDLVSEELGLGCVKVVDNADFSDLLDVNHARQVPVNPLYNQKLYALVLTPTRELAIQVMNHLEAAAKYTGIRVAVVIGGLAAQKQERLLKTRPEIVVATPGRLWELIQEGNQHLQQVDDIRYLAIDETDRMVEKGHFQELQQLLLRINTDETKRKVRQNFVFSATLTMVHEPPHRKKADKKKRVTPGQKLQDVVGMLGISHPKVVDVTKQSGTSGTLEEAQIKCVFEEKDYYLYYFLIANPGRTLIFCNSISCVRRLAQLLTILRCKPLPIHANMLQKQRLRNLDKFRDNPTSLLLATDVAARGLDIPDVQHVIHYQVPRTSEGYIHRSGRTARASKKGLTLVLIEPAEHSSYARLCRTLGRDQELPPFEVSQDLLTAAKQRVNLARDIDQLELTSRKADVEHGWFQKALTDMDMVLDKEDLPLRISVKETAGKRKVANGKRKDLEALLARPLFSSRN